MTAEESSGRRAAPGAPAPWVLDGLLALGVTLTVSLLIAADGVDHGTSPWTHTWAVLFGAVLLVRRRHPVLVVVGSVVAFFGYYATGNPPIGVAVPVAAAMFSAAERGRLRTATLGSVVVVIGSVSYRLASGQDPAVIVGYELPGHVILLGCAIALGDSIRSRRALRRQADEIEALTAERLRHDAQQHVLAERLAIARELHDTVGHALTVVNLHTEVAQEAAAAQDDQAVRDALEVVAMTTATTFTDLRRAVTILRQRPPGPGPTNTGPTSPGPTSTGPTNTGPTSPGPTERAPVRLPDTLANLEAATRPAQDAGLEVQTRVSVLSHVPSSVQAAAFRIVQESITNILRHASATRVRVDVNEADGILHVLVDNDQVSTPTPPAAHHPGHGISGMRERTHLLGGHFTAGPTASGFSVHATFPLEVPS